MLPCVLFSVFFFKRVISLFILWFFVLLKSTYFLKDGDIEQT